MISTIASKWLIENWLMLFGLVDVAYNLSSSKDMKGGLVVLILQKEVNYY